MITVSPSLRNLRMAGVSVLLASGISLEPLQEPSSMEPRESCVGPEMVPVPRRSPAFMLQPVTLWKVQLGSTIS
jgi:hypothetical protein